LLGGDDTVTAQKVDEMPERGGITGARPYTTSAISQVLCGKIGRDGA